MDVDCQIPLSFVTESLCKQLEKLEPYGVGNPEPRFIISDFEIKNPTLLIFFKFNHELIVKLTHFIIYIHFENMRHASIWTSTPRNGILARLKGRAHGSLASMQSS